MSMLNSMKLCLDIRGNVIRFIEGYRDDHNIYVEKFGTVVLDHKFIEDGVIQKNEETIKILKNVISLNKIQTKNVKLSLRHQSMIFRIVKIPDMPKEDLDLFLDAEIERILQLTREEVSYDYQLLDKVLDGDKSYWNVLIVSIPRKTQSEYTELFAKANLQVSVMDVYPNSIYRIFATEQEKDIAVVGVNGSYLEFMIISQGKIFMQTDTFLDDFAGFSVDGSDQKISLLHDELVLNEMMKPLYSFITSYMTYFSSRNEGKTLDEIYLIGSISELGQIDQYFEKRFKVKSFRGFPDDLMIQSSQNLIHYLGALGLLFRKD